METFETRFKIKIYQLYHTAIPGDNLCEKCSEMYGIGTAPNRAEFPSYSYTQGYDSGGKVSVFVHPSKHAKAGHYYPSTKRQFDGVSLVGVKWTIGYMLAGMYFYL